MTDSPKRLSDEEFLNLKMTAVQTGSVDRIMLLVQETERARVNEAAALELMRQNEWNSGDSGGGYGCHECFQSNKHQEGCEWDAVLKAGR